jgi:predicted dehydrogenase
MPHLAGLHAAVIGAGFIGTVHVEALRRLGVEVVGLLSSSGERGAARAAELGIGRAYADLDELLADDRVQVVHVTSPNEFHTAQVESALAAGRHVVCEKPLSLTSAESASLCALAAGSGLVAAVNFNLRFYPLNLHAADMVREGGVGDVRLVTGRYFQDWLLYETDWNWRVDDQRPGALRAVADIGSHWLDLASFLTGLRVESVMADLATFMPVRMRPSGRIETFSRATGEATEPVSVRTEDVATVLLRFEGGARGSVAISQVSAGRKNSLQYEIDGGSASVAWDSEEPERLWIGHRDRPNEIVLRDPGQMAGAARRSTRLPAGHGEGFADTFVALFSAIYADVARGGPAERPAYPTLADGHRSLLIGDAVAESAATGRWATVRDDAPVSSATADAGGAT